MLDMYVADEVIFDIFEKNDMEGDFWSSGGS
jgi:hypothetical protein